MLNITSSRGRNLGVRNRLYFNIAKRKDHLNQWSRHSSPVPGMVENLIKVSMLNKRTCQVFFESYVVMGQLPQDSKHRMKESSPFSPNVKSIIHLQIRPNKQISVVLIWLTFVAGAFMQNA